MKTKLPVRIITALCPLLLLAAFASQLCAQPTPLQLAVRGSWPAFPGFNPGEALTVADHFLYVSGGGGFQVFDVANPAQPVQVGGVKLDAQPSHRIWQKNGWRLEGNLPHGRG